MNLLNQQLKAIQTSKAYLYNELKHETNPHIIEKIQHQLHGLDKEETEILNQLNLHLEDITLTEKEDDTQ